MTTLTFKSKCALALVSGAFLAIPAALADKPEWAGGGNKGGKGNRSEQRVNDRGERHHSKGKSARNKHAAAPQAGHFRERHGVLVRDYYELETHYLQNLVQWNRYAEHAAAAVGGSWTHHKRYGEEGPVYTPVEPEYQRRAMAFLDEHVLATPDWALDADLLRRLEHAGAVERIRAYQELAVQRLLNAPRLARMIEHEAFLGAATYRPAEMLDDARGMVWREVAERRPIDTYRRNLQRAWLEQALHLLTEAETDGWRPPPSGNLRVGRDDDPPLNADLHIVQSDIRPLVRERQHVTQGERIGRIILGSQVVLVLPTRELLVSLGDRVKAGVTEVAR